MKGLKDISSLAQILKCEVKEQEPMFLHTSFKIGGNAALFIRVKKASQLGEIVKFCTEENIEYIILGKGSNLLVSDGGVDKVVIALEGDFKGIDLLDSETIYCGSGASLAKLCSKALSCNLSGLEFAWGIPGSVGGAVFMNAGAYGGEMKDVVYSVAQMDKYGKMETVLASKLDFSYRHSAFRDNGCIILGVTVKLHVEDPAVIRHKMDAYMERRKEKQPLDYPSAGSIFKRPEGAYAGTLIEQCGLKGTSIGGAQISEKHAGFIVNTGHATCEDVKKLIALVQKEVKEKTGYFLDKEVICI